MTAGFGHDGVVRPVRVPPAARLLVDHLTDGAALPGPLADLEGWLATSSRLRAFVEANRDKIRKKVRLATSDDARMDLWAELRVATRLLADRRIELAFEAYGAGNRGPDFTATYRARRAFNVEVTRRHGPAADGLERTILAKLRQLPPSRANVLVVAVDALGGVAPDPAPVIRELRTRADRRDDAWFAARGLTDAAAFHQGVLRLSAVLSWTEPPGGRSDAHPWANSGARIALEAAALRAIEAALRDKPD
jgi:hypothetical protein